MKRNAEGWTTNWTIQNVANIPVDGVIDVFGTGGGQEAALPFILGPFASIAVSAEDIPELRDGFVGAAVVTASHPIAAVVTGERPGSDRYAYEGVTTGAATLFAPMVLKERDGWSTGIQVLNLGTDATTVQIAHVGSSGGRWGETVELPGYGSATVYQPANPALPSGFTGSAIITSLSGQPLVALVNQARDNGATMAYAAAAGGSERLEAPVLFKRYNGWDSAVQLFNLGNNGAPATITYNGAPQPIWESALVPANGGTTVLQSASGLLPEGYAGSATVQAPTGSRITGIVSEVRSGTMAAMSYSAGAAPGAMLAVPHVIRAANGWTSGLEVQNANGVPVMVVLTLYDEAGSMVHRVQEVIQSGATRNFYLAAIDGVPDGFRGSAIVQSLSGHPVLAVVNEVGR